MWHGDSDNLILTGFMGTGKTSVGQEIARRLKRKFVDMDALIEAREGMTVADIFDRRGEEHFRRLEANLCRELAARSNSNQKNGRGLVIATGGGALIPKRNREILCASGAVVCLSASLEEILRRLDASNNRPLLRAKDRVSGIIKLLEKRTEAYQKIPFEVETTHMSITQVAERVIAVADTPVETDIPVCYPGGGYAVHLGRGLIDRAGGLLREHELGDQIIVVTNPTVGDLYANRFVDSLEKERFRVSICTVPDGEQYKILDTVRSLYDKFGESGLDRHGTVVALGGGVIGDMAGFAAATYLRGVSLVHVPTTLLAMVDASIGGKVAVNHPRGKNLIGAFKQPALVLTDPGVLDTLPKQEMDNGLAEAIKAGMIGDPELFEHIETYGPNPKPWIISRAIKLKVAIVEGDPYEKGSRAMLNLGHTFGHALELMSDFLLPHGSGVSIGLNAATRLSARMNRCDPDLAGRMRALLDLLDLPATYRDYDPTQVWEAMATDKKRHGKKLSFVLPSAIGNVFVTGEVKQEDVLAVLETIREA